MREECKTWYRGNNKNEEELLVYRSRDGCWVTLDIIPRAGCWASLALGQEVAIGFPCGW